MSIVELQKRARRLGEIRLGDTVTKNGKTRPVSLDTFRLTSAAKGLLTQAADLWGGEVVPWDRKWQLVTDASELPIIVPPQDPDNVTWYEAWTAAGLQRRCDGETIVNRDEGLPCVCDPNHRECRMVTRLQVMLPDLPDVGVWTLSSTGYYAAAEMAMSIQIVMDAAQKTGLLPAASLAIEHREIKRPNEPLKKFVVPVLRFADPLSTFLDTPQLAPQDTAPALPQAGGEGSEGEAAPDTAHPHPVLPPSEPTFDQPNPQPEVEAEVVDEVPDDAWPELLALLNEAPADGVMDEIKDRVYRLYRLMHVVGVWPENARQAALQKHYQTEHLSDLRKAELSVFASKSFMAAKDSMPVVP